MTATLAPRVAALPAPWRWLVFAGFGMAVLVLAWLVLVWPALYAIGIRPSWQDEAQEMLARDRGAIAQSDLIRQQIKATAESPIAVRFYAGDSDAAVASAVQGDISALLAAIQVPIQSMNPLPARQLGRLSLSGVRISMSLTIDQLKGVLESLARNPRYLHIDRLALTAPQTQSAEGNPTLTLSMEISGARKVAAPLDPKRNRSNSAAPAPGAVE